MTVHVPSITISTDSRLLARYLCFLARSLQLKKHLQDDYIVLPLQYVKHKEAILFPDYDFSTHFWQNLQSVSEYGLCHHYPESVLSEAMIAVKQLELDQSVIPNELQEQLEAFVATLGSFFDTTVLGSINNICVISTTFGSAGTFSKNKVSNKKQLLCTIRLDLPLNNLYEVILKGIISVAQTYSYTSLGTVAYQRQNAVSDFLQHNTKLSTFFPRQPEHEISPVLRVVSRKYLEDCGLAGITLIQVQTFSEQLSKQEKKVFLTLVAHDGTIVTFNELATEVWSEQATEKFSLYALAKIVESIRRKLILFRIYRQLIFTVRKQGYLFLGQ